MEYKEDVRTFLKRDFSVFAVRSGQHKADLIKGTKDYLKALKLTRELSMLRILPHVLLKQLRLVQKNQEEYIYLINLIV